MARIYESDDEADDEADDEDEAVLLPTLLSSLSFPKRNYFLFSGEKMATVNMAFTFRIKIMFDCHFS